MKDIVGWSALALIMAGSAFAVFLDAGYEAHGNPTKRVAVFFGKTIVLFVIAYVVLAGIGGVLWVIAWVGIMVHECEQWMIEAILIPFRWLWGML